MAVSVLVARRILLLDRAHAQSHHALALDDGVRHLDDHHVAAIALAALDVATGRRTVAGRRDDLEEVMSRRADHVRQAPFGDAGVAVGHVDAERVTQLLARALEVLAYEHALPELHGVPPNPL